MGKKAKKIGRKDAMDAFCFQCSFTEFNTDGRRDCQNTVCPLYEYSPHKGLDSVFPWAAIRTGNSVGLTPKKGVSAEEFAQAADMIVQWRFGGNTSAMPGIIQKQFSEILSVVNGETITGSEIEIPAEGAGRAEDDENRGW